MSLDRDRLSVLEKVKFFKKVSVWSFNYRIDPTAWLSNFNVDEQDIAVALLDACVYFSPELTNRILVATFHRLSAYLPETAGTDRASAWDRFRRRAIVTYPTDERPNATDSGRGYLRKGRAVLALLQEQFMDPEAALQARCSNPERPVVFLDDFAGSGSQFCETWTRPYDFGGVQRSFASCVQGAQIAYLPILSTTLAVDNIGKCAPSVLLEPGHTLGPEYSALSANSIIWPSPELQARALGVLRSASARAGIPLGDGEHVDDWCGYRRLGLALAIDDTTPDACLTLLYWEKNGWRPLFRRP